MSTEPAPPLAAKPDFLKQRLLSLDVYRGLIMVALAFECCGIAATAYRHLNAGEDKALWEPIRFQFSHVEWVGCAFWDLIQPSFMFMVGVAAAYSFAKRAESGSGAIRQFLRVCWRAFILVALGIFLISNNKPATEWSLMNVLSQIGLGYPFLYLLWGRGFRVQALATVAILAGTYLLYVTWPDTGIPIESGAPEVGVTAEWAKQHLAGVSPAWHKNANAGHAIDLWLLNLLPLQEEFKFNAGGYQTINFLPSLATMLLGLMCGELLRSARSSGQKTLLLLLGGVLGLASGLALDAYGDCPLVKRIWTPSWALYSTGWCCLILGELYVIVDVLGLKFWTWPLAVVGVNSIAIYCMGMLLKGWTAKAWMTHLGPDVFTSWGDDIMFGYLWEPTVRMTMVGMTFWLMCVWMWRQKIFVRI